MYLGTMEPEIVTCADTEAVNPSARINKYIFFILRIKVTTENYNQKKTGVNPAFNYYFGTTLPPIFGRPPFAGVTVFAGVVGVVVVLFSPEFVLVSVFG